MKLCSISEVTFVIKTIQSQVAVKTSLVSLQHDKFQFTNHILNSTTNPGETLHNVKADGHLPAEKGMTFFQAIYVPISSLEQQKHSVVH